MILKLARDRKISPKLISNNSIYLNGKIFNVTSVLIAKIHSMSSVEAYLILDKAFYSIVVLKFHLVSMKWFLFRIQMSFKRACRQSGRQAGGQAKTKCYAYCIVYTVDTRYFIAGNFHDLFFGLRCSLWLSVYFFSFSLCVFGMTMYSHLRAWENGYWENNESYHWNYKRKIGFVSDIRLCLYIYVCMQRKFNFEDKSFDSHNDLRQAAAHRRRRHTTFSIACKTRHVT